MEPGPDQAVIRPAVSPVRVIRLGGAAGKTGKGAESECLKKKKK